MIHAPQIIDANLNRVSEGLRVIEDYTRFISGQKTETDALSRLRKAINGAETHAEQHLMIRDIAADLRAMEVPAKRKSVWELLKANFKRVEEGLRVLEEYTGNPLFNRARYQVYQLEKTILLPLAQKPIRPGIYLISEDPEVLVKGLDWGVSMIQLRQKGGAKLTVLKAARRLQHMARKAGIPFIVNDHLDIALLVDADGFHSGQDEIPVTEQRRLLGAHKIIGRTTHTLKQGLKAQAEGADYVSVGPLWETPSKPGRKGIGLDYLGHAKAALSIPYVAIGGIDWSRFEVVKAYDPPLIGLVRDYENIPKMLDYFGRGS